MTATELLRDFVYRATERGKLRTDGGYKSLLVSPKQAAFLRDLANRENRIHPSSGLVESIDIGRAGTGYTLLEPLRGGEFYRIRVPADADLSFDDAASSAPAHTHSNGCCEKKEVSVTTGVFRKDGRIYVVKPNKEKTRYYAKEIVESARRMTEAGEVVDFETVYRPGVVFDLTENDRWQLAEAAEFLTRYSRCIVCGRTLKAAKSVAGAIGPVCAKYFASTAPVLPTGKVTIDLREPKKLEAFVASFRRHTPEHEALMNPAAV